MPADLLRAITHAFKILSWYENLEEEEIPPEWMWPFDDELKLWFEEMAEARKAKYNGSGSGDTEVPLMENELSRGRR